MKFKRSILLASFAITTLFSAERFAMKEHLGTVTDKSTIILCTNSHGTGVDCGVFSIENNKPVLLLSTFVKNEQISNFTDTITQLLTHLKDTYGFTIKYACFGGLGVPSANQDYLEHWRLPYVIDAKQIIAQNNLNC